ncbi:MAG: DUF1156 domain-containing protein [Anaerolineae bacterium]|nr:DUF1156 domain-containing protein [Anaerolineae bacterium]
MPNPPRLIEVDLPIKAISAHARREKSIRHGHISTLHIWWARRPLAACRAVLCAALWPDPADDACPQAFRDVAALALAHFAEQVRTDRALAELCAPHWSRWNRTNEASLRPADPACWPDLRYALLDFIADFANWDASTNPTFLETARLLTQTAHLADSGFSIADFGLPETRQRAVLPLPEQIQILKSKIANHPRPLVADPFAGGGAIPLEALRVGADAFASDLNPVAVLLNKVVLEYIPKYGRGEADADRGPETEDRDAGFPPSAGGRPSLAEAVRDYGARIKAQAEAELAEFYPADEDGATPIAYLWARTVTCEGPGCGAEVPLMRSFWLGKKKNRPAALRWVKDRAGHMQTETAIVTYMNGETREVRCPLLEVFVPKSNKEVDSMGTAARGAATCPCCGYTTPVESVRRQLKARRGGADDARLFCVVTTHPGEQGRFYRLPTARDLEAVERAKAELERRKGESERMNLAPDEPTPQGGGSGAGRAFSQRNYGMDQFRDLFTARQILALTTLARLVCESGEQLLKDYDAGFAAAVQTCLGLAVSRLADRTSSLCTWRPQADQEKVEHVFSRQALPMTWDFAEGTPLIEGTASWDDAYAPPAQLIEALAPILLYRGTVVRVSATNNVLPDMAASAFFTDPPYYDAVPYADLSDYFYVWLKRTLPISVLGDFSEELTPKTDECIVDEIKGKDKAYFEQMMTQAMSEARRILSSNGIGIVVFAHKSTAGWEAQLQAMIDAGLTITGSWPLDTEMGSRLRAMGSAALASSIHLVVRPRAASAGIGDWRDVLHALPERIHAWMPRLAEAGIVGADAIFACLGPALELFSRYDRVEKASGEQITLGVYLEHVWAAVSREALSMIFAGADATGFDEDARLTAMWLWTLSTDDAALHGRSKASPSPDDDDGDDAAAPVAVSTSGYTLEYDAARKIAQGLGAHLERLTHLVEIKGSAARLLPVAARSKHLFGEDVRAAESRRKAAAPQQLGFGDMAPVEGAGGSADWAALQNRLESEGITLGETVLDRLHQAMLLFAAGRSDALKRLLVDEGVGQDGRFWRLAQALSALYPLGSEEKRWVDGVMARKKGLGF